MRMPYLTGLVLLAMTSGCAEDDKNPPPVNEIEDSGNVSMTAAPSTAGDTAGSGTTGGTAATGGSGAGTGMGTADSTGTGPVVITGTGTTAGSSDDGPIMTTDQLPSG